MLFGYVNKGRQRGSRDIPNILFPRKGITEEVLAVKLGLGLGLSRILSGSISSTIRLDGYVTAIVALKGSGAILSGPHKIIHIRAGGGSEVGGGEALADGAAREILTNKAAQTIVYARANRTGTIAVDDRLIIATNKSSHNLSGIGSRGALDLNIGVTGIDAPLILCHKAANTIPH